MLANGGEFNGNRILSQESIDRMTTPLSQDIMSEMGPTLWHGHGVQRFRDA